MIDSRSGSLKKRKFGFMPGACCVIGEVSCFFLNSLFMLWADGVSTQLSFAQHVLKLPC